MKKKLWDYGVIVFGCGVYALAVNAFFRPNQFALGGFTGVAQIVNRLFPWLPVGAVVFSMNLPLILLSVRKQGWAALVSTLFAITVSAVLLDTLDGAWAFLPADPLLACVYGSILMGFSLGLLMRKNTTTGGTELAARLLKYRFRHLSIGRLCLIIDFGVVCLYALVFRDINNTLYGIIAMYIATRVLDMVVYGTVNARVALVVSDHSRAITQTLLDMNLGVTVLEGKGAWTETPRQVILCVFKRNLIAAIKAAATRIDPAAFIIVCDAREVLGQGFGAYSEDSL